MSIEQNAIVEYPTTELGLSVIPRTAFCNEHFYYKPGEHVLFGGPTQRGKTSLAFDLLEPTISPDLPAYIVVSKPKDPVSETRGKDLKLRVVREWPVARQFNELWNGAPNGYMIWPKFGDIDKDMVKVADVTRRVLADRYTAGVRNKKGILVMDDTMVKSKILGLDQEMVTILAMAGAMGIGEWVFVQKPTDSGRTAIWSYSMSEHIFLLYDPVETNQKRYGEIGGIDPKFIVQATKRLKPFQFLYIKRTEKYCCIVDKK